MSLPVVRIGKLFRFGQEQPAPISTFTLIDETLQSTGGFGEVADFSQKREAFSLELAKRRMHPETR